MRFRIIAVAVFAAAALGAAGSTARATDWTAYSTTAMAITGDVSLDHETITLGGRHKFRIKRVRALSAAELEAMHEFTGSEALAEASLYKIDIPANTKLRNGNTICGRAATTRMIAARKSARGEKQLVLVFFSGSRNPFFEGWRSTVNSGICGSFGFTQ